MSGIGSGHDQSCDTFSPAGRVIQVEYAGKAVDNSSTALGICCKDGVVVAVEKILSSKMLEAGSNSRCHAVDLQAGVCIAGVLGDGKNIVDRAKSEAEFSRSLWKEPMTGSNMAERVAEYMHAHTSHWAYRPFGCSILLASYADDGPQLFLSDPSGTVAGYHGCAVGKAKTVAKTELEKLNFQELTCREAVKKAAEILYQVHDSVKDKLYEIEIAWVCDESKRRFKHVPAELIPPKPSA